MTHIAVREYERLYRGRGDEETGERRGERRILSDKHFRRLRSFDEQQAGQEGELLFEWRRNKVWPKQWVGVVQAGGLTVEILPKIASTSGNDDAAGVEGRRFARRNLLYMLAMAGELPMRPRDVADLGTDSGSMLDIFVDIFARRLLEELKRGRHRSYVQRRKNRNVLKGKLQFSEHVKHNAARKDRFFVEYDEYLEDNRLNRIFRAACRSLRGAISRPSTDEKLKQCLMLLEDVADVSVEPPDFERVHFDRKNRRFEESFDFCRMLYLGQAPTGTFGQTRTYSVLFDMNALYEKFITEFIRRHVLTGELRDRLRLDPQSKRVKRYLLWTGPSTPKGPVRMQPDILLTRRGGGAETGGDEPAAVIIDTKWKELEAASSGGTAGITTGDLYQLYAYTQRYGTGASLLLYPRTGGGLSRDRYVLPESVEQTEADLKHVGVEFVDLGRDLAGSREAREGLVAELKKLVREWDDTELTGG